MRGGSFGPTEPVEEQSSGALWFGFVAAQLAAFVLPLACIVEGLGAPSVGSRKGMCVVAVITFPAFQIISLQRVAELRRRNLTSWRTAGWIAVACFGVTFASILAWRYWWA
jgi:NADH:ubiquinone oxidoreductase subunit 6 (subunit J)